jgi:hypothetical protein
MPAATRRLSLSLTAPDHARLTEAARRLSLQASRLALRYVLAGLDAGQPAPPPGGPGTPPSDPANPEGWIGGPVGRGGKSRVVRGERITRPLPEGVGDVDFVGCSADGLHLFPEGLGRNVRWLGGRIDRMAPDPRYGTHGIYVVAPLRPTPLGFVMQRVACHGWRTRNKVEMKGSWWAIVECEWEDSGGQMRMRRGEQNIVSGNRRLGSISLRDNLNAVLGNTGGHVTAWAGRLGAGYDAWKDERVPGGGQNYYAAADNFLATGEGNQPVYVGAPSGDRGQYRQHKALRNCVDPGSAGRVRRLEEEGTWTGSRAEWEQRRRSAFLTRAVADSTLEELLRLPAPDDDRDDFDDELAALERLIAHADEARRLGA